MANDKSSRPSPCANKRSVLESARPADPPLAIRRKSRRFMIHVPDLYRFGDDASAYITTREGTCCRAAQPIAIKSRQPEPTSGVGAGASHRDAVVRMEPRETAYEKKAPFRSWASSENSFTEVPAGSDANCAVAVFPDQAICPTFCTKSPAKLFSTSRIFVRPMA